MTYNQYRGIYSGQKAKIAILVATIGLAIAVTFSFFSQAKAAAGYTLEPWTFVGTTEGCIGTEGNVISEWRNLPGVASPVLYLQKNSATEDCSSAGARVLGEEAGITVTQLSFEYKSDTSCGAGAPRFNVNGSDYFFGCTGGTATILDNGWTRVDQDVSVLEGVNVTSISILFDETGSTYLNNISINSQVITGTVNPVLSTKDQCRNGNWTSFGFKNQGQCIASVQSSDNSKHRR